MSKILAVFGATGQQGSSVIKHVLDDPELSKQYTIRAITRDVASAKATQLKANSEVVAGDVTDPSSLETALTGVHTVFAMTNPDFGPNGFDIEYNSGKAIADAAVAQGVKYIIFSTLPHVKELSGGKYIGVMHLDAKAKIERYIRSLEIESAFVSPGFFMENLHNMPFLRPQKTSSGIWVIARHNSPEAMMPMIDAAGDTGKFVGAILADPDRYEGKTFCAATMQYSNEQVAATISKVSGKDVVYKQISPEEWKQKLPFAQDIFIEAFSYPEEFGYYGPDSDELVAWAVENARGQPSTLEEFFVAHPLHLA